MDPDVVLVDMLAILLLKGLKPSITLVWSDKGPMEAFKWVIHAERMANRLNLVTTQKARQELESHWMVGISPAWWKSIEDSMLEESLATITMAEFKTLFEA